MKKSQIFINAICIIVAIVVAVATIVIPIRKPENAKSQYNCNTHPFALTVDIDVAGADKDDAYNITGEFFSAYEDNLTMRDQNGDVVREMDDSYNFISQNDHVILDGNGILYSCEGNINIMGNSYDIFNNQKEQIGTVEFNAWNTRGEMRNMDGVVVAQYDSNIFCTDYVVSVFENCEIDDASVLMMFASYFSDIRADS